MEAEACHDFNATAGDELSFRKNDILKIINMEQDKNWYKAELNGNIGYVPANFIKMKPHQWYHGNLTRSQSEQQLLSKLGGKYLQPDGAFLVRLSERTQSAGDFSLSVKWGSGVQHFKVLREDNSGSYFLWMVKFNSINELVEYHRRSSVSRFERIYLKDMVDCTEEVTLVKALFDFTAEEDGEISFCRGDVIMVVDKPDQNWWVGTIQGQNIQGHFPSTYVTSI